MPKEKKEKTITIRVRQSFADELELVADYLQDGSGQFVSRDVLLYEWVKPHLQEHLDKAIAHKMAKLKALQRRK